MLKIVHQIKKCIPLEKKLLSSPSTLVFCVYFFYANTQSLELCTCTNVVSVKKKVNE